MDGETAGTARGAYRAFISYSHRDAAFAARLHRRLEGYRLPKGVGERPRLNPIFKDREELPAAHDLSAQVRAALAASEALIVVCSPDAAASPWVGREIETFRALHPGRPILAALARGEPAEAFPPALAATGAEPLAADFRKTGDGERLALLKLAAGLSDIGVDRLIQRDAQRRLRSVMAVTAAALAAVLAMGGMTAIAITARAEAERQRAGVERMVSFMLTDLRAELDGEVRMSVLAALNQQIIDYYEGQDLRYLTTESQDLRARMLHASGEVDFTSSKIQHATEKFDAAISITSRLLKQYPNSKKQIWSHAQSEYWVGRMAFERGDLEEAARRFLTYQELALRLTRLEPRNGSSWRELGYATGNLCSVQLSVRPANKDKALNYCKSALEYMINASRLLPDRMQIRLDLARRHAWLADARLQGGDIAGAIAERKAQEAIISSLVKGRPANWRLTYEALTIRRSLGSLAFKAGQIEEAQARYATLQADADRLSEVDPDNRDLSELKILIARDIANLAKRGALR